MEQCYSIIQGKKTSTYGKRQYEQLFTTFPMRLRRLWHLEKGQVLEWRLIGGDELVAKKVKFKPTRSPMKYEEWLTKIEPCIPTDGAGKTYDEIRNEAGVGLRSAPAEWVHKAEIEIRLNRVQDKKLHRILWTRAKQHDAIDHKQKELKFRDQTLKEFQDNRDEPALTSKVGSVSA